MYNNNQVLNIQVHCKLFENNKNCTRGHHETYCDNNILELKTTIVNIIHQCHGDNSVYGCQSTSNTFPILCSNRISTLQLVKTSFKFS